MAVGVGAGGAGTEVAVGAGIAVGALAGTAVGVNKAAATVEDGMPVGNRVAATEGAVAAAGCGVSVGAEVEAGASVAVAATAAGVPGVPPSPQAARAVKANTGMIIAAKWPQKLILDLPWCIKEYASRPQS